MKQHKKWYGENNTIDGCSITFGIQPSYPETGYGYINIEHEKLADGYKVKEFVEKPNKETAQKYIDAKTYFWNSGIFMFKASTFLEELNNANKEIYKLLTAFNFEQSNEIPYVLLDRKSVV